MKYTLFWHYLWSASYQQQPFKVFTFCNYFFIYWCSLLGTESPVLVLNSNCRPKNEGCTRKDAACNLYNLITLISASLPTYSPAELYEMNANANRIFRAAVALKMFSWRKTAGQSQESQCICHGGYRWLWLFIKNSSTKQDKVTDFKSFSGVNKWRDIMCLLFASSFAIIDYPPHYMGAPDMTCKASMEKRLKYMRIHFSPKSLAV